eukprot:scaffold16004_cov161-Isochrysis_galbana.AAC.3
MTDDLFSGWSMPVGKEKSGHAKSTRIESCARPYVRRQQQVAPAATCTRGVHAAHHPAARPETPLVCGRQAGGWAGAAPVEAGLKRGGASWRCQSRSGRLRPGSAPPQPGSRRIPAGRRAADAGDGIAMVGSGRA